MNTEKLKSPFVGACLAFLIIASISLPSGSFFGIPVKHIAYISSASSIIYLWLQRRSRIEPKLIILLTFSLAYTIFFMLVGSSKGIALPAHAIQEGTGVFTTISVALLGLIAINQKWTTAEDLIRYSVWGGTIFSLVKNAAAISMAAGIISFPATQALFANYLNAKFVSSAIFGGLVRVNLIIYDFVVLLILSICLTYPQLTKDCGKKLLAIFKISAAICIFFAFSRYLFIGAALLILHSFLTKWSLRTKIAALIICVPAVALNYSWFEGVIEQRFTSTQNIESDEKRTEQINALVSQWSRSPWIGGGFGSYSTELIRDTSTPYSYEVQWFGFLTKLGIIGITFPLFLIYLTIQSILRNNKPKEVGPIIIMLLLFIGGGFTNQYLITSGSGVFYLLCLSTAEAIRNRKQPENA